MRLREERQGATPQRCRLRTTRTGTEFFKLLFAFWNAMSCRDDIDETLLRFASPLLRQDIEDAHLTALGLLLLPHHARRRLRPAGTGPRGSRENRAHRRDLRREPQLRPSLRPVSRRRRHRRRY